MKTNALILLWNGEELPDYLAGKIAEILFLNKICIPEMLTIKYKDTDGVANALLRDTEAKKIHFDQPSDELTKEALRQSVVYIGELFKKELSSTNGKVDVVDFTIKLYNKVAAEKKKSLWHNDAETPLLTAIEEIATCNELPITLANKYHITKGIEEVIRRVFISIG